MHLRMWELLKSLRHPPNVLIVHIPQLTSCDFLTPNQIKSKYTKLSIIDLKNYLDNISIILKKIKKKSNRPDKVESS